MAAGAQSADNVANWLLLRGPDEMLVPGWESLKDWSVPDFPLGGRDILALGINAGPAVARVLGETKRQWIAEDFPGSDRIREIASQVAASAS